MKNTLSAFVLISWSGCALAQNYVVTNLGTVPGGDVIPTAINSVGQVAGVINFYNASPPASPSHAFRYSNHQLQDLGTGNGLYSGATGIDSAGSVAGYYVNADASVETAAVWKGTSVTALQPVGGTTAYGSGINSAGQVAGASTTNSGNPNLHAVLWNGTTPTDLGTLGGIGSAANGINDAGQVVGISDTSATSPANPSVHAFLYDNGTMTDLGTLGGRSSVAYSINNSGQIVGYSNSGTGNASFQYAVLWSGGKIIDLSGGSQSVAYGINDAGTIVGRIQMQSRQATVWRGTTAYNLNSEIATSIASQVNLYEALAINNDGIIVAEGSDNQGNSLGYILTPIPVALSELQNEATGAAPGSGLAIEALIAKVLYEVPDVQASCAVLGAFVSEVQALNEKRISQTLDAQLTSDAQAIELAIGCQ